MEKNEVESIGMILDDEGLGVQLGGKRNILTLYLEKDGKADPEAFPTLAIQKGDAVLWHEMGAERKVKSWLGSKGQEWRMPPFLRH